MKKLWPIVVLAIAMAVMAFGLGACATSSPEQRASQHGTVLECTKSFRYRHGRRWDGYNCLVLKSTGTKKIFLPE